MANLLAVSLPVASDSPWDVDRDKASERLFSQATEKLMAAGAHAVLKFDLPMLPSATLPDLQLMRSTIETGDGEVERLAQVLRDAIGRTSSESAVKSAEYSAQTFWFDCRDEFPVKKWPQVHAVIKNLHEKIRSVAQKYQEKKSFYNIISSRLLAGRRSMESALTGDIALLVPSEAVVDTPLFATLMVAVPLDLEVLWLQNFKKMTGWVIPDSGTLHFKDSTHALYSVYMFRKSVQEFEMAATAKGFVVRPFALTTEAHEERKQEMAKLIKEEADFKMGMLRWCEDSLCDVDRWRLHLLALRLAGDSTERYGLDTPFKAFFVSAPSRAVEAIQYAYETCAYPRAGEDVGPNGA